MNLGAVLALWAADDADAATTAEFVRVATAAAAAGLAVAMLDVGPETGREHAVPAAVQEHLDALAAAGAARHRAASPAALRAALRNARTLLRLGSPARAANPPLLVISDAWIESTPDEGLVEALRSAGQVVRA